MTDNTIVLDADVVKRMIEQAVEQQINNTISALREEPDWTARIAQQVNNAVVDSVLLQLSRMDLTPTIRQRVDENMSGIKQQLLDNFASTGIVDQASACQLTVMDEATVVENQLVTRDLKVVKTAVMQDLVVLGSVNIDNPSWTQLANGISERTLNQLTDAWKDQLTQQVAEQIKTAGIDFDSVQVNGTELVNGNTLGNAITESNLQQTGTLRTLEVAGESVFNNQTLSVLNRRIGVNTVTPEMALSVWDEEVSIVVGKNKANEAYVGTNRAQGIAIGTNRVPQIEITAEGLTKIKQLQIGVHKISHDVRVPGWSGTRGDLVFNSNPGDDAVFAWVCLGAYKWKPLKSAA